MGDDVFPVRHARGGTRGRWFFTNSPLMSDHGTSRTKMRVSIQKRKAKVPRSFLHFCMTEWAKTYLHAEQVTPAIWIPMPIRLMSLAGAPTCATIGPKHSTTI